MYHSTVIVSNLYFDVNIISLFDDSFETNQEN